MVQTSSQTLGADLTVAQLIALLQQLTTNGVPIAPVQPGADSNTDPSTTVPPGVGSPVPSGGSNAAVAPAAAVAAGNVPSAAPVPAVAPAPVPAVAPAPVPAVAPAPVPAVAPAPVPAVASVVAVAPAPVPAVAPVPTAAVGIAPVTVAATLTATLPPTVTNVPAPSPAVHATAGGHVHGQWYAVTVGRNVGVFCGWNNVGPLVNGVSGFCVQRYPTRQDAIDAFEEAEEAGLVQLK
ncbi:hypothetical protein H0H93_007958 [Arthromyces matolae]|nr:hypothetical protein H0H93_007958 [Arthromyces matolae]